MKRIYATTEPVEAEMICLALRDHEIPHHLEDAEGMLMSFVGPHSAIPWAIYVHDEDVERATAVIKEVLEARKRAARQEPDAGPGAPPVDSGEL